MDSGIYGRVAQKGEGILKKVKGYSQAGYGGWYREGDPRNFAEHVPEEEHQSISRAELRAIVRVLAGKEMAKPLHVVLDAHYICKGITEWLPQWVPQGWSGASGPVGHRD